MNTLFQDQARADKLEEAIRLGFIIRQIGADNVCSYILTQQGQMQWMQEKMMKGMMR